MRKRYPITREITRRKQSVSMLQKKSCSAILSITNYIYSVVTDNLKILTSQRSPVVLLFQALATWIPLPACLLSKAKEQP